MLPTTRPVACSIVTKGTSLPAAWAARAASTSPAMPSGVDPSSGIQRQIRAAPGRGQPGQVIAGQGFEPDVTTLEHDGFDPDVHRHRPSVRER